MIALLAFLAVADASDAERQRLQTELHLQARRASWSGADRTYRQLVALEAPLTGEDHLIGYQAAQNLGDALAAARRLQRVPPLRGAAAAEASRLLENLRATHGLVAIYAPPEELPRLDAVVAPFAPDKRAAIALARDMLARTGEVRALLPVGAYTVDGRPFEVRASPEPGAEGWFGPWQVLVIDSRPHERPRAN